MSSPQNSVSTLLKPQKKPALIRVKTVLTLPQKSPLGPKKVKNDPKNESKYNVKSERNKENESCSTT